MSVELPLAPLIAFLLATVRASAWLLVTPPFRTRAIPVQARVGLAMAIALPTAGRLAATAPPAEPAALAQAALVQVAAGLALGIVVMILVAALEAAGSIVDLLGGFAMGAAYDPMSEMTSTVFARIQQLLATTLLFVLNGHLLVLHGFMASYDALPLTGGIATDRITEIITHDLGTFLLAAAQIAAPLVVVSFVAEIGLGILSRAAPALNIISVGFPLKILVTLLLAATMLAAAPGAVTRLVNEALRSMAALVGVT